MTTETPAPLVVAHHNGWSANYGPTDHRGYRTTYTTVTGYGDRFADFIGPGTTFVDARTAPDELWTWFAIAGPIPCAAPVITMTRPLRSMCAPCCGELSVVGCRLSVRRDQAH